MKKYIGNPFFLYSVSWVIVLFLYQFKWTSLYPDLDSSLIGFLIVSSLVSLLFAVIYSKKCQFVKLKNPNIFYYRIIKLVRITYLLLFCDCLFSGTFPFIDYLRGADMGLYKEVGIPFLHVIVINMDALLFYLSAYCYFSIRTRKNKFIIPMLLTLLCPLVYMNRGETMFLLFGFFMMYLMQSKQIAKKILTVIPVALFVVYLFGMLGNIRSNDATGNFILNLGGASDEFVNSGVPHEFFWGYLYTVTPLGNLQNAINNKKHFQSKGSGPDIVFVHEILPKFISKRLNVPVPNSENYRVVYSLNVGTTYFDSYIIYGWLGMWMVYSAIMAYCVFMLKTIPFNSIFRIPLLCLLSTITFFSLFSNMITFMAFFPQLVFIFLYRKKCLAN